MATPRPTGEAGTTVGRDAEVARVLEVVDAATSGGLVLVGDAGVGKSHVLARAGRLLAARGHQVVRVQGDAATASVPFASVRGAAEPPATDGAWAERLHLVVDALSGPVGAVPGVVVADDLQHLDPGTTAALVHAVTAGRARVLGSVRRGEVVPDAVAGLWRSGLVERHDLAALSRADAAALAATILGGPLERASERRLWIWTEGNPLFVRELLASARDTGALTRVRGQWRLGASVAGAESLRSLLGHRLAGRSPAVRRVAEALAVADQLPAAVLAAVAGSDAVGEAERAQVITVADDAQLTTRLAHPLHGEVLRDELGPEQVRAWQQELIDRVEAWPGLGDDDRVRLAIWHLETGRVADDTVDVLTDAAQRVWVANQSDLTARLARRAWELGGQPAIALLLCEALLRLGEGTEMAEVARAVAAGPHGDQERAAAVAYECTALRIWANDPARAIERATGYAATITDPEHRLALDVLVAGAHQDMGHPHEAARIAAAVIEAGVPGPASAAAMVLVPALGSMGRLDDALAAADRALEAAFGSGGQELNDLGAHLLFRTDVAGMLGHLDESALALESAHEAVEASGDLLAIGWLTFTAGRVALRRGRPDAAARWLLDAANAFADLHRPAWEAWAQGGLAAALALVGDREGARAAVRRTRELARWSSPFGAADVERSLAWVWVIEGDVALAQDQLRRALDQAEATGEVFTMAVIANDQARVGDVAAAAAVFARIDGQVDGALAAGWALRARSLHAGDPDALGDAGDHLAALGARLDAAECHAVRAQLYRDAGDDRGAAAATRRAREVLHDGVVPATPALLGLRNPELTDRERAVASLAAQGRSRRDIADELFLSVRTVDSHLQRVYKKLGIRGLEGLPDSLA